MGWVQIPGIETNPWGGEQILGAGADPWDGDRSLGWVWIPGMRNKSSMPEAAPCTAANPRQGQSIFPGPPINRILHQAPWAPRAAPCLSFPNPSVQHKPFLARRAPQPRGEARNRIPQGLCRCAGDGETGGRSQHKPARSPGWGACDSEAGERPLLPLCWAPSSSRAGAAGSVGASETSRCDLAGPGETKGCFPTWA